MSAKDTYLIAYNSFCCLGWAYLLGLCLDSLVSDLVLNKAETTLSGAMVNVFGKPFVATALTISQSAAILEIAHAAMGLVRSPVMVTFMQVSSRIVALYAILQSVNAQYQWGAALMMISWALVEVPRYAFYVSALISGDATKGTPYPLFWLRYSLFAILYPTGIVGELTVFWAAAHDPKFGPAPLKFFYGTLLPIVYFFGSPFMIFNMAANRKSAFKKRFAKPPPPPRGLVWPKDKRGERSSTDTNKQIVAAALEAIAPPEVAQKALKERNWRFNYVKHLEQLVISQCASPEDAVKAAQAGLDKAYELFEFVAPDGSALSFKEAMAATNTEQFYTGFIQGTGKDPVNELRVPYKDQVLSGKALKDQIKQWVDYGTVEPSAGEALCKTADNPAWLQDFKNRYFVLLGAGSAMGPLRVLLALGANVVAIDLDRPGIWKGLLQLAKDSPGTMTFPLNVDPKTLSDSNDINVLAEYAGCNLFTHTPLIRDWLLDLYKDKPLTVGSYAYLDGALHVQVSLAMDAVCRDLSEKRPNTSLVYLCTPTDLHLIPKEAHDAAEANFKEYSEKPYCILMGLLSGGKFLRKNVKKPTIGKSGTFYHCNGISIAQGPNYALAKRMQHWRAIIARSKGCIVSSNIAPSTSTVSVVHNRTFAWAYEGMPYFKPFEIFAPDTSKAVMLGILAYDLNDPASVGNPKTVLDNPNQLFSYGAFHGGLWRCAYEVDSIGEASVFLYFGSVAKPYLKIAGPAALGIIAAIIAKRQ